MALTKTGSEGVTFLGIANGKLVKRVSAPTTRLNSTHHKNR
jgi:hypothetical protein